MNGDGIRKPGVLQPSSQKLLDQVNLTNTGKKN